MPDCMDERDILSEKAAKLFLEGYNCSQSVLLAMFEHWGGKSELVPKIGTGFGGGIGRCGSVCGALTGGIMALGIKYGTNEPSAERRLPAYEISRKFLEQFKKRNRGIFCKELIGYTLSNPDEYEKARKENVFQKKCVEYVKNAVTVLLELTEPKTT
jgi:C_GCAxxG_C_C family probable redox protein